MNEKNENTEKLRKWELNKSYIITGIINLQGEFGEYPGFVTVNDEILTIEGIDILKTVEGIDILKTVVELSNVFERYPDIAFCLKLEQQKSEHGILYNILTEIFIHPGYRQYKEENKYE